MIDGEQVSNRKYWLVGAQQFLAEKFAEPLNPIEEQKLGVAMLEEMGDLREARGSHFQDLHLWDVLKSRGSLQGSTGVGFDGIPNEVWKCIPLSLLMTILQAFNFRFRGLIEAGSEWPQLEYFGIRKPDCPDNTLFSSLRWIAKSATAQKWFLKTVMARAVVDLPPTPALTCGFEKAMQCSHVIDVLRQSLASCDRWGGDIYIASADLLTAFDMMQHDARARTIVKRGMHPSAVAAVLREYVGLQGRATMAGVGTSEPFHLQKAGRQGGVDTPKELNIMVEISLHKCLETWSRKGWGFRPRGSTEGPALTHAVWADNVYLIAASLEDLQSMIEELSAELLWLGFDWKPTSLKLLAGAASHPRSSLTAPSRAESRLPFAVVDEMECLGNLLSREGSTMSSINHRMAAGDRCFWKHHKALMDDSARLSDKLMGFYRAVPVSVLHGSETWAINETVAKRLHWWELGHLRRIAKLRPGPDEDPHSFFEKAAYRVRTWRGLMGHQALHHRALHSVFRWAYRLRHAEASGRAVTPFLLKLQDHRPMWWWEENSQEMSYLDPRQEQAAWRHRVPGVQRTPWEYPLHLGLGPEWRSICSKASAREWKVLTRDAIDAICQSWELPKLPDKPKKLKKKEQPKRLPKPRQRKGKKEVIPAGIGKSGEMPSNNQWNQQLKLEIWTQARGELRHVVDSETVAGWLNGTTDFKGDQDLDVLARETVDKMVWSYEHFKSANAGGVFLEWRSRDLNIEADWACNLALDHQTPFHWWNLNVERDRVDHIIIYSDGALRDPEEQPPNLIAGAYGYAIRAWDIDGGAILLGLGAELYNYPNKTVPLLEMLGVGEAHTQLHYYLANQTDTDDTIKANWLKGLHYSHICQSN